MVTDSRSRSCMWNWWTRLRDAVPDNVPRTSITKFFGEYIPRIEGDADLPAWSSIHRVVEVQCWHPYWPMDAIQKGLRVRGAMGETDMAAKVMWEQCMIEITYGQPIWNELACKVAKAFAGDGEWSVDILATHRGWFVTDMADGPQSFHGPCARPGVQNHTDAGEQFDPKLVTRTGATDYG